MIERQTAERGHVARAFRAAALIVLVLTLGSCRGCVRRGSTAADSRLDTLYRPEYASGFAILRAGEHSSVITIANPWQGANGVRSDLFLARGGEEPPRGFVGTVVKAPLRRVVCMSSSYVAFIDALGEQNAIVGVSGLRYVYNNRIHAQEVGYDAQVNYELLATLQPDLMLVYGVSDENAQVTVKLRELGIPYIYVGEYVERSPLGRAEWLVAFGEMFNRRGEAQEQFERVRSSYLRTRSLAAGVAERSRVLFNAPYGDVWYMPSQESYMAQLVRDAGGVYEVSGESASADAAVESHVVSTESAFVLAHEADVWLNPGSAMSMSDVLRDNPRFGQVPAVVGGRVFNNNARTTAAGGSDFWESAVVRPDVVLQDLVFIMHPSLLPAHKMIYFHQMR